ncbi:CHAD domain-containing protein [Arthrobacter sp.]|uniref:CHAD domain-containing protein n=1 Tax=Arthrobacter sp. TaxID=1667 RepID=UPI003392A1A8
MSTKGADQGGPKAAAADHGQGAPAGHEQGASPLPPRAEPSLKGPAADMLLDAVRGHFLQLTELAGPARRNAPDAVHQMRTATRRMRSVLKAYRKLLDPAPDRLQDELMWLAGELAAARDAEVQTERLGRLLAVAVEDQTDGEARGYEKDIGTGAAGHNDGSETAGHNNGPGTEAATGNVRPDVDRQLDRQLERTVLPGAPGTAPAVRRLKAELAERLAAGHRQVVRALNGKRYRRLMTDIAAWLDQPPLAPLASEPARQIVPRLVGRQLKRLRAAASSALAAPEGTTQAEEALHETRKRAKRLRYAAEAAAVLSPVDAADLGQAAHEIQSVLGEHQDAVVARQLLRRVAAKAAHHGEDTFLYGRLDALEQAAAQEAVSRFDTLWRRFPSAKPKSWGKPWKPA